MYVYNIFTFKKYLKDFRTFTKMSSSLSDAPKKADDLSSKNKVLATPKPTNVNPLDPRIFFSPETPLQVNTSSLPQIQRDKEVLENNIMILKEKKKTLQKELENIRKNIVSFGELTKLKAQSMLSLAVNNAESSEKLMKKYISTVHECQQLKNHIECLEEQVTFHELQRATILDEIDAAYRGMDFSKIVIRVPEVKSLDYSTINASTVADIDRLQQKLEQIKLELSDLNYVKPPTVVFHEAASEYARSVESHCNHRSLGVQELRANISSLQKSVADSDSHIRKLEKENIESSDNLISLNVKLSDEYSLANSKNDIAKQSFDQSIKEMEENIAKLRTDILETVQLYDSIEDEVNHIKVQMVNSGRVDIVHDDYIDTYEQACPSDDVSYSFNAEENANRIQVLIKQKQDLQDEIKQLKTDYYKMKNNAINRDARTQKEIAFLLEEYTERKRLIEANETGSYEIVSPVTKIIGSLIDRIETSIVEMSTALQ